MSGELGKGASIHFFQVRTTCRLPHETEALDPINRTFSRNKKTERRQVEKCNMPKIENRVSYVVVIFFRVQ